MLTTNSSSKNITVVQVQGNIVSDMGGEKVMMSIEKGKYYNLGETGGIIWDLMKSPITLEDIVNCLVSQFDVNHYECEEQVFMFLKNLINEGLVQIID